MSNSSEHIVKPNIEPSAGGGTNAIVGGSAVKHGGHYIFLVGIRQRNFVAYNVDAYELSDEIVIDEDILPMRYKELTPVIQKLKSETWSCDCDWFFVVQGEGIYLMNVFKETFFLCKKHSHKFIEMFINAPLKFK